MGKGWRPRPHSLPLRLRLTLWYTASLGLILLLFASFLYLQLRHSLLAQVDVGLDVMATQALLNLASADDRLLFPDQENNPQIIRLLNDDFMLYLLSSEGQLWAELGNEKDAPISPVLELGYQTIATKEGRWRVYQQVIERGRVSGWLQVVQELEPIEQTLNNLLGQMALGLPLALLLASLGGFFLAGRALNPIHQITQTAQAIKASDLQQRIGYTGPDDEVGRLAHTIDQMLARLHTAFERERRFTGDAAHELRTPLTALKGRIGVTLSQPRTPTDYVATLQEMDQQVDRLIRVSQDLLLLARLDQSSTAPAAEQLDLADLLGAIIDQVRPLAENKSITLDVVLPDSIPFDGQTDWLIRLFLNLLDNAIKYTPPQGRITIQGKVLAGTVQITIEDTGPGIPAEHLPHLFARFYRVEGDRTRRGTEPTGAGLGLALAHEIVRAHGGKLGVQSEPGQGTAFVVQLPLIAKD